MRKSDGIWHLSNLGGCLAQSYLSKEVELVSRSSYVEDKNPTNRLKQASKQSRRIDAQHKLTSCDHS